MGTILVALSLAFLPKAARCEILGLNVDAMSRMKARSLIIACAFFACAGPSFGAESPLAPPLLRGKSVELSWTSSWTTKNLDNGDIYRDRMQQDASAFYFSSAGRVFSRRTITHQYGGGETLSVDAVDRRGVGGISYYSQIEFTGQTMQAVRAAGNAAAIRLVVQFNPSFTSCSASVHLARAPGASTFINPWSNKVKLELLSVTSGEASCRVESRNVFE
jgi:hypothetical protein